MKMEIIQKNRDKKIIEIGEAVYAEGKEFFRAAHIPNEYKRSGAQALTKDEEEKLAKEAKDKEAKDKKGSSSTEKKDEKKDDKAKKEEKKVEKKGRASKRLVSPEFSLAALSSLRSGRVFVWKNCWEGRSKRAAST